MAALRCPVCRAELDTGRTGLVCPAGHAFDMARHGYVDLTGGRVTHAGDSSEMVAARTAVLRAGHLDLVTSALLAAIPTGTLAVDVGAGTGHHLAAILRSQPDMVGLALDISKPALRRAGRADPRMGAVRCDVWRWLPIADGCADLVLNVFAPRNAEEFHRVLRRDGRLVVVIPTEQHLANLVRTLGLLAVDPAKSSRLADQLAGRFELVEDRGYTAELALGRDEVTAMVGMGPSAWHLAPAVLAERMTALAAPVLTTAAIRCSVYRPLPPAGSSAR